MQMKLILFGHPAFFGSHSMDRFAAMIADGMRQRGHEVQLWAPAAVLSRLPASGGMRKWLGYVDQYILFPALVWWRLRKVDGQTLMVLTDHALGMWMPLLRRRAHVIHCHDLIAQRMLAGEFPQYQLSASGRVYQGLIRRGLRLGKLFVAVSGKTAQDLLRLHPGAAERVRVVHNGLNYPYRPLAPDEALRRFRDAGVTGVCAGMLLHIGSNQWYKNREGVLALYEAYCRRTGNPRPLVMIGPAPTQAMRERADLARQAGGTVSFLEGMSTACVHAGYALAGVLLFPSLAEGFGWPIIEAMACGTPVLTTALAPMQDVGGGLASLVEPMVGMSPQEWAQRNVHVLLELLAWPEPRLQALGERLVQWAGQFSADRALDQYERIYLAALAAN